MIDWKQTNWGDVCVLSYGKALKGYQDIEADFPVFGTNGQIGWWHKALQEEPGVIVGRKGAYRGVHFSSIPFYVIDTAYALKPSEHLDARWAYYCLLAVDINSMDSGSAIPSTNRDEFYAMPLLLPSLAEQREIAAILGALDDKIELNRKSAATLEDMARALYKSWFVDFDPVVAKSEGRQPTFMDAETAALFPDSFGDDGLPEGWIYSTIGEVAKIVGGATPRTKEPDYWDDGQHLWATPKDLSGLGQPVIFDTDRKITDAGLSKISSGLSPAGTLLLSSRAPIGYTAIAQKPIAINQGFIAIRETQEITGLEAYFWCAENMDIIHANANGSTFQEISKKNFKPLEYIVPDISVRAAFNELAGQWFERLSKLYEENQTLAELRDTLLPKLMSGELRVGEAKEQVDDVA